MVTNEAISSVNVSDMVKEILPSVLEKFSAIAPIFQVVGVVFLIYILFLIVKIIFGFRDSSRLKRIEEKLDILVQTKNHPSFKKKNKK